MDLHRKKGLTPEEQELTMKVRQLSAQIGELQRKRAYFQKTKGDDPRQVERELQQKLDERERLIDRLEKIDKRARAY